jgi:hypothetical protein
MPPVPSAKSGSGIRRFIVILAVMSGSNGRHTFAETLAVIAAWKEVNMARRITQIACCQSECSVETIYALCDDGTLWNGIYTRDGLKWHEIDAHFTKEGGGNVPPTAASENAGG